MYDPKWSRLGETFESNFAKPQGLAIKACQISFDAPEQLAAFARYTLSGTGLLISDENTHAVCGEEIVSALHDQSVAIREHCFALPLDATEERGEEVVKLADGADFILSIGSGTLSDLAKYAGHKLGLPVILYATAASMNGYTSGIVALKVRGLKRTIPCTPAIGIFSNPAHAATAPQRMTAAGVADFLSKSSSTTDWRCSHILLDKPFDPSVRRFSEGIQDLILERAPDIGRAEPEAVGLVLEALMLSGFAMVVAGSSAPASGGEHLISHYIDMKSALYDLPHDLHGTQVGVATIYCLGLWEKIMLLESNDIDVDKLVERQPSDQQVSEWIQQDWGPVAPEVQEQWDAKKMDSAELRKHLETFKSSLPRLHEELPTDLLSAETVRRAIEESGGPVEAKQLSAPLLEYQNGQERGRYIRSRFTVLDLAQDLGLT